MKNNGIFLPNEILELKNINSNEKILLAFIYSFDNCFVSNEYFAELLQLGTVRVSQIISKLKKYNYIKTEQTRDKKTEKWSKRTITINKKLIKQEPEAQGPEAEQKPEQLKHIDILKTSFSNSEIIEKFKEWLKAWYLKNKSPMLNDILKNKIQVFKTVYQTETEQMEGIKNALNNNYFNFKQVLTFETKNEWKTKNERKYTPEQFNAMYDNIDEIEI